MNNTTRLASIDFLLKDLPKFQCVEGCSLCCGPFGATRLEWKRIVQVSGRSEKDIRKEAERRMANFEKTKDPLSLKCPLLTEQGKCSVYAVRPATCQLFGLVEHDLLTCPVGGIAERKIPNNEAEVIMRQIDRLGN